MRRVIWAETCLTWNTPRPVEAIETVPTCFYHTHLFAPGIPPALLKRLKLTDYLLIRIATNAWNTPRAVEAIETAG